MPRNNKEYALKRNEILDAAQRFVYTKGYEQMTIQNILDDLHISKGAFYHYFDSKQALLEAIIERMLLEVDKIILPIVQDSHLPALDKFQLFFDATARWKTARKTFLLGLLRGWYKDENALVRQKVTASGLDRVTPLLTAIIRQGMQEGVFSARYPDQVAQVAFSLIQALGETLARMMLSDEQPQENPPPFESTLAAYTDALERVLGAAPGTLRLFDAETLKEWVVSPSTHL
jgi:AcrR family transcriptional regulator